MSWECASPWRREGVNFEPELVFGIGSKGRRGLHERSQTVCWCDIGDGEIHERVLDRQQDVVRGFDQQFTAPAVIGVEAVGYAGWFRRLLEELGRQVRVGDAYTIRKLARRRQKNDRRDAALLLDMRC